MVQFRVCPDGAEAPCSVRVPVCPASADARCDMKMRMRVRSVGVAPCKKVKTIIWQVGKNIHDTLSQMNAYVFMALPGFAEGSGESVVQGVRGSLGPGDSGWLQNLQEEVMSCPDPSRVVASRFPEG